ncbi:MAG: autotransporter assembly complex family protein [Pseudomonadota bacterium]
MRTVSRRFYPAALCTAVLAALLGACGGAQTADGPAFERPDTAISYQVSVQGLPTPEMEERAASVLSTFRRQEDGANSPAFLKRRAQEDVAVLQKLLRSEGHYAGKSEIEITQTDEGADLIFLVEPGPAFTLTRHEFDTSATDTELDAGGFGSPIGSAAKAEAIVNAERAALEQLKRGGYPYARLGKRRAIADIEAATIEVRTPIDAGPRAVFGPLRVSGLDRVRERYLRTYLTWEEGAVFDTSKLTSYQRLLLGTDIFDTVSVKPPKTTEGDGEPVAVPVLVEVAERPFRTAAAGARFDTDAGPSVTGSVEHRNIWGENETLTVEAELGVQVQTLGIGYREPQYQRPGQDLLASLTLTREDDDAFDGISATATLGLQRKLGPRWLGGAGTLLEVSQITDQGVTSEAYLFGVPVFAEYDGSDDKLNPSTGQRLRLELTPFVGSFDGSFAGFLTADAIGSAYFDLTGSKDYIFASRARLASILTDELETVPQTRRLYAGGGGSVRGYAQDFIGPLDTSNDPVGGLSALELGAEMRARLYGDLGGTIFVEAGSVSEQSFPDFAEGMQVAAGLGLRYFSPAGPIRVDFAVPLNQRDADDDFQIYFSIGQAF